MENNNVVNVDFKFRNFTTKPKTKLTLLYNLEPTVIFIHEYNILKSKQ